MWKYIEDKISSLEVLNRKVHGWRLTREKVVFTNGCFDILHYGHVRYLAQAREHGHRLIVGLNSDASVKLLKGENRPIQDERTRATILASLLAVDAVVIFDEETPLHLIKTILPDVLAKGGDYTVENIVGATEVKANGGEVVVIPFEEGFSTTKIISKIEKN